MKFNNYNRVIFEILVSTIRSNSTKILTESVEKDKSIFINSVVEMMLNEKFNHLIKHISCQTKIQTEVLHKEFIKHIIKNYKNSVIFNESFISQPIDKIVDGFIKEFDVKHKIGDYIWFVVADWLRFNTIKSKTKNSNKVIGNYFVSMKDFTQSIVGKITKNKQKLLSTYSTGKVKYERYLTERSKAYEEYLDKNKSVEPFFKNMKNHIENLHKFQATKFESHPTMYIPQDVIDKKKQNDKTAIDSQHSDDIYGLPFGYIKKEDTTSELKLYNTMNKIKILASAIQKVLGEDNLVTSKNDTALEGAIAWGFDSVVCFFVKTLYKNIVGTQYDKSTVIEYFIEKLMNEDVMLPSLYMDFLHVYGESLDKNNLDFLDYDEVMEWEDKVYGKNEDGSLKLSPNQINDKKIEDEVIQVYKGKKITSSILYDELKELEYQLSQAITKKEEDKIKFKLQNKQNELIKFVKSHNNIKVDEIEFNIEQTEKLRLFNLELYSDYLKNHATPEIRKANMQPLEGKTEEWVTNNLPKQLVAYRMSNTSYNEAIKTLKDRLIKEKSASQSKPFSFYMDIGKKAKISDEEFKSIFGEHSLDDIDFEMTSTH